MRRRAHVEDMTVEGMPTKLLQPCFYCWREPGDERMQFWQRWGKARNEWGEAHGLQYHEVPKLTANPVTCAEHIPDANAWRATQGLPPIPPQAVAG